MRRENWLTAATCVDHIVPHRGDMKLFWNTDNWQPLCDGCHASGKQREENRGHAIGCDAAGWPHDPGHHWRAATPATSRRWR